MKKIILTCEHGGALIPPEFRSLFTGKQKVLRTHRGLDIGALAIAFELQKILKVQLIYSEVTRLLIDLNRFLNSQTLFSEFTKALDKPVKNQIIAKYYTPHWNKVEKAVLKESKKKNQIYHIAVHSMTDNLDGQLRPMQFALLYDPKQPLEKLFASVWIQELRREFPYFKMARNNPYKGSDEGLTTHFRNRLQISEYVGIELEMNQGLLKTLRTPAQKNHFAKRVAASLTRALSKM